MSRPSDVTGSGLSANSLDLALTADDVALPEDRVCLDCGERPIIGKPYSVYCCVECYDRWVHCFECGNDLPCEVHRDESNTPEMPVGERNAEQIADTVAEPRCVCGHRERSHFGLNKRLGDCCHCHCWEWRPARTDGTGCA